MRHLSTPGVSALADVAALVGLDGWLTPPLQPIVPAPVAGRGSVRTVTLAVAESGTGLGPVYELLSSDLSGQVLVVSGAAALDGAIWGEILATAAQSSGALAVLVDGAVRDQPEMMFIGLPVYAREQRVVGPAARAHVVAVDAPIEIGGVHITCEDTIAFDAVGCIRLQAAREWEVLDAARRYNEAEQRVLDALRNGAPLSAAYLYKKAVVDTLKDEWKGVTTGHGRAL